MADRQYYINIVLRDRSSIRTFRPTSAYIILVDQLRVQTSKHAQLFEYLMKISYSTYKIFK